MHLTAWLLPLRHRVAQLRARVKKRMTIAYDANGVPIPPEHLSSLVTGGFDTNWFLTSGKRGAESLRDVLSKNGVDIAGFDAILDFGCGVGRVLRHLPMLTGARLFGCDYNRKLIAWCRRNLSFAEFGINQPEARLHYDDRSFDFVYALSIFTHFTEAQHVFWSNELRRVLRPGGYLLLTTHGNYFEQHIPEHLKTRFQNGELVVVRPDRAGQNICAAYQPEKYVRDTLARGWEVIDFVEQGAMGNYPQDVYLLRKPPEQVSS
jgi:SAM-dependent methyltransferase